MGFLDRFFKRNVKLDNEEIKPTTQPNIPNLEPHIELPEGEIVQFTDEVLDTNSVETIEKLKHNLEILIKKAKETGKVDKFMLIREDDFFPVDWEWRVLSQNTNLERVFTKLSLELKKTYALEQSGIAPYIDLMGLKVPNASREETLEALSKVDKNIGSILLPSRFRSTKHFTVNTPLGVTGDYNSVSANRDYIIIDDINAFLASEYGYSVAYHDAYLDISHESLPISPNAVVLINTENYDRIMSDEKIASELSQRRIVQFKGDEDIAIDMILTEMGALPSRIGSKYATYDNEVHEILDNSMRELAKKHSLFFDKSHGGQLKPDGGHFSNYYDGKNQDYEKALGEFTAFLRQKFPEYENLLSDYLISSESGIEEIIDKIGTTKLLEAIDEYNQSVRQRVQKTLEEYKQDRQNITPEIHTKFVATINLINNFYKSNTDYVSPEVEQAIQKFLQGKTVEEQLEAAQSVWELLPSKKIVLDEDSRKKQELLHVVSDVTITELGFITDETKKVAAPENSLEQGENINEERN